MICRMAGNIAAGYVPTFTEALKEILAEGGGVDQGVAQMKSIAAFSVALATEIVRETDMQFPLSVPKEKG